MKTLLLAAVSAAVLSLGVAAPAYAKPKNNPSPTPSPTQSFGSISVIESGCVSVYNPEGCLFSGNINASDSGNNSYLHAQNAYNFYNDTHPSANSDIALNPILAAGVLSNTTSKSGEPGEIISGTYTFTGFLVEFFAVKAGPNFVLYGLDTPSSSFNWSTAQLDGKGVSHVIAFGSVGVIPEPATWAMMIGGFGLVGAAMRRRHRASAALA